MTTPSRDDHQQWQQPSWDDSDPAGVAEPSLIEPAPPQSGTVLMPVVSAGPPSVAESAMNVVAAVAWPLAIVLAILGFGGWLLNLGAAFVISAAAGAIGGELRKRRGKTS